VSLDPDTGCLAAARAAAAYAVVARAAAAYAVVTHAAAAHAAAARAAAARAVAARAVAVGLVVWKQVGHAGHVEREVVLPLHPARTRSRPASAMYRSLPMKV